MKTYAGVEVKIHIFLTSAPDGDAWSASTPQQPYPQYPLSRRPDGFQSRSERGGEEKNFAPTGNGTLAIQPVAQALYWQNYSGFGKYHKIIIIGSGILFTLCYCVHKT